MLTTGLMHVQVYVAAHKEAVLSWRHLSKTPASGCTPIAAALAPVHVHRIRVVKNATRSWQDERGVHRTVARDERKVYLGVVWTARTHSGCCWRRAAQVPL